MKKKAVSPYKTLHYAIKTVMIGLIFLVASLGFSMTVSAEQVADVDITSNGIHATSLVPGTSFMMLRVVGPNGKVIFNQSADNSSLQWTMSGALSDGHYSYEIRIGTSAKKQRRDDEGVQQAAPLVHPRVQSGHLLIQNGTIVDPSGEEDTSMLEGILLFAVNSAATIMDYLVSPVYADQIILDDVIIDGSGCIGMDCVNGEGFNFDTLRLKENNLRIHFQDTSTSASFPSNDWRISINDSSNGGGNYFGIDDVNSGRSPFRIEAGAPSYALYVDDYGRIGVNTSTPAVELHIMGGNTPTVRLDQDGSYGWPAQSWDVGGNEASFFIRDVTNSSALPFRIEPGSESNSLAIKNDGKVGIGTWEPEAALHVEGDAFISGNLEIGSSRTLKQNIAPIDTKEAVDALKKLYPVRFNYKASPEEESIGFIAEDVPDLVATKNRESIRPMDVIAVLTKVIQEQQISIERLSARINNIEKEKAKIKFEQGKP